MVFTEKGALMCQPEAVEILNEVFRQCQNIFPCEIRDAYLYGSYARGDYNNESGVDILLTVDLEPAEVSRYRNQISAISSDLSLAHEVTVSITVKSFDYFHRYSTTLPFYKNVLTEGIRYTTGADDPVRR
ncbi:nucleotidyltransferase family protein [Acutalibacter muris]|uniref:nucleotidyltransferase family protein n=1 Tax=Acutalibacter muris TaxID=1796620 RepID=UPI001A9A6DF2|nr:nucleotidyltransferase domain-containing protein [Acutalibacter muris]